MYKPLLAVISTGLAGFGAPLLEQVRELIKDLWFRNKEESKRLALENKQRDMSIGRKPSISPNPIILIFILSPSTGQLQPSDSQLIAQVRECVQDVLKQSL